MLHPFLASSIVPLVTTRQYPSTPDCVPSAMALFPSKVGTGSKGSGAGCHGAFYRLFNITRPCAQGHWCGERRPPPPGSHSPASGLSTQGADPDRPQPRPGLGICLVSVPQVLPAGLEGESGSSWSSSA